MTGFTLRLTVVFSILTPCSPALAQGQNERPPASAVRDIYLHNCATCHGVRGDGSGPSARHLSVAPRDFTSGVFKFQTTPVGDPPLDSDILRTIDQGLSGTPMIGWKYILSDRDRHALVQYVRKFAPLEDFPPSAPITVPEAPPVTPERIARGSQVYRENKCWECHGDRGEGDGPKADELLDDWSEKIKPTNFRRGRTKRGNSAADIYVTLTFGVNGTPMPSFSDAIREEDRWALAYYVRLMARKGFLAWLEDL